MGMMRDRWVEILFVSRARALANDRKFAARVRRNLAVAEYVHTLGISRVRTLKYLYSVSSIIRGYIHISIISIGGQ